MTSSIQLREQTRERVSHRENGSIATRTPTPNHPRKVTGHGNAEITQDSVDGALAASPAQRRAAELASFFTTYELFCKCAPVKLRSEGARFECAGCGSPLRTRRCA